ncbi:uncharacterized protein K452DRAFT_321712 [Aplosporella prunicola CBS 121167]|uniref:Isochorismatase-like domain-containing protein n=1 Tax=Aplosporella prunicola CBS 121167 TaxID=1176127 RepID=A0A6A6AZW1_9PEZI|nr:uncharacterized protein K452DRAFT_321712 [Aplosporella prunicola CBS 121167]KAF2137459.1 hypothetical protein K452DRAFT_321712 [Aplosporella prunicola CBS 121167]
MATVSFERLNVSDAALLILDLQVGLYHLARDFDPTLYRNNMLAHAALDQLFDIPVIMTTSAQTDEPWPNGPLPKEILEMYPTAPLIQRQGEVNAWDNADFRAAVRATGRNQLIMAGIVTDVCTACLALSLRAEGYSVWANVEASGTTTPLIRGVSNARMQAAGVQLVSLFSIVCDLMRDWRNPPGSAGVLSFLERWYPTYAYLAKAHGTAAENGTLVAGEEVLLAES